MRSLLLACAALVLSLLAAPAADAAAQVNICTSPLRTYPGVPTVPNCTAPKVRSLPCYDSAVARHQSMYQNEVIARLDQACILERTYDLSEFFLTVIDASILNLQTELAAATALCNAGDPVACDLAAYYQSSLTELQATRTTMYDLMVDMAIEMSALYATAVQTAADADAIFTLAVARCCMVPGGPPPQPLAPELPEGAPAALYVALAGLTL